MHDLANLSRLALLAGTAATLAGCATRGSLVMDCPELNPKLVESRHDEVLNCDAPGRPACKAGSRTLSAAANADGMATAIAAAIAAGQDGKQNVLLLSGGGQWGAFGAGLLNELNDPSGNLVQPENPLLNLSVSTCISTGCFQQLFLSAHLGGYAGALEKMETLYKPESEKELVNRNSKYLAVITGSLAGFKPLRRAIDRELQATDSSGKTLLDAIANAPVPAYAGFVDFAANQLMQVDLRELARLRDKKEARTCLAAVTLASSAIPFNYQQVRIRHRDGSSQNAPTVLRTYVDGGVSRGVFFDQAAKGAQQGYTESVAKRQQLKLSDAIAPTIYVVRNGPTYVEVDLRREQLDRNDYNALTAVENVVSSLVNRMEQDSITGLRVNYPNGPIKFVTANGFHQFQWESKTKGCPRTDSETFFETRFMACLAAYGHYKARNGPWTDLPISEAASK